MQKINIFESEGTWFMIFIDKVYSDNPISINLYNFNTKKIVKVIHETEKTIVDLKDTNNIFKSGIALVQSNFDPFRPLVVVQWRIQFNENINPLSFVVFDTDTNIIRGSFSSENILFNEDSDWMHLVWEMESEDDIKIIYLQVDKKTEEKTQKMIEIYSLSADE